MMGSQSSSCSLCWSQTSSAASSDEFILNIVSVYVPEKKTSYPEVCHAVLDTLTLAHKVSGRLFWAITPHSALHGKPQQSLKDGLGDQICPEKKLVTCARRWDSSRVVMACLPTGLPLHGRHHLCPFRACPGEGTAVCSGSWVPLWQEHTAESCSHFWIPQPPAELEE